MMFSPVRTYFSAPVGTIAEKDVERRSEEAARDPIRQSTQGDYRAPPDDHFPRDVYSSDLYQLMMEFELDRASEVTVMRNEEIAYPTAFHLASGLLPLAQRKLAEAKENGTHMEPI